MFDTLREDQIIDLVAWMEGYAPTEVQNLRPPTREPMLVVLNRGSTLRGRVVGETGAAVPQAKIHAVPRSMRQSRGYNPLARDPDQKAIADENGSFELRSMASAHWTLYVDDLEGGEGELDVQTSGEDLDVEIRIRRGALMTGRVLSTQGQPVSGARVRLEWTAGKSSSSADSFPTDATGRYRLSTSWRGPARLIAAHPAHADAALEIAVAPGRHVHDLHLAPGWEISGRVIDQDGSRVANALVHHVREGGHPGMASFMSMVSTTDQGLFRFRVPEGRYYLAAMRDGYAVATTELPIEVFGGSVGGVELVMTQGGAIVGRVLGLEVEDLAGMEISSTPLSTVAREIDYLGMASVGVDLEGRFRIDHLMAGEWQVSASSAAGNRRSTRIVELAASSEAYVELEFERGFEVLGVVLQQGSPVVGAGVALVREGGGSRSARTDQNGPSWRRQFCRDRIV